MKDYIDRYKKLPWQGKILSIPGIVIHLFVAIVIFPFWLISEMIEYADNVIDG
jgi:flagellar biosynthesis protein FliQ